jgi:hypothetical protein
MSAAKPSSSKLRRFRRLRMATRKTFSFCAVLATWTRAFTIPEAQTAHAQFKMQNKNMQDVRRDPVK